MAWVSDLERETNRTLVYPPGNTLLEHGKCEMALGPGV